MITTEQNKFFDILETKKKGPVENDSYLITLSRWSIGGGTRQDYKKKIW
jgi:hypothetical protein